MVNSCYLLSFQYHYSLLDLRKRNALVETLSDFMLFIWLGLGVFFFQYVSFDTSVFIPRVSGLLCNLIFAG